MRGERGCPSPIAHGSPCSRCWRCWRAQRNAPARMFRASTRAGSSRSSTRTDITDPTGAYADAASPAYDDSAWRSVDLPHDWSIELDPTHARHQSGTGYLQGGLGWYRKTFTLPAADCRQADLRRLRRRLHGQLRLPQRHAGRQPPVRLHGPELRPHAARPHRRHAERARRQGAEQAAEQPLVLRQRHLPPRPSRRHGPDPRRALRHVRDHAGRREHVRAAGSPTSHVETDRARTSRRLTARSACSAGHRRGRQRRRHEPVDVAAAGDATDRSTSGSTTRICGRPTTRTSTRCTPT